MTTQPKLSFTKARLGFRTAALARWLAIVGLPLAAACSGLDSRIGGLRPNDGPQGPDATTGSQEVGTGIQDAATGTSLDVGTVPNHHAPITSTDQLDLLFMIDDSSSMQPLQAKLAQRLADFMNILKLLPGGPPSLHIAVVSSSLGAGAFGNVPGCSRPSGDRQGLFQRPANCTMLSGEQNFIIADHGANNFSGDITDAFSCITQVGDQGCGFEHQFSSTIAALQRASSMADPNSGFLRPNAFLGIVMLTNEDDCSTPPDYSSLLFDPGVDTVANLRGLGGLQSYRCNEFGHLCNGLPPPHDPPALGTTVTLTGCTSSEGMSPLHVGSAPDGPAYDGGSAFDPLRQLITVDEVANFLKGLKTDPSRVFVAALAGTPSPYIVGSHVFALASGASEVQPSIQHSCSSSAGEYADPAVRVAQLIRAFGPNGVFETICADDFQSAMMTIGNSMVGTMTP